MPGQLPRVGVHRRPAHPGGVEGRQGGRHDQVGPADTVSPRPQDIFGRPVKNILGLGRIWLFLQGIRHAF